MLKYLIVQLDDTSVSFCHYANSKTEPRLMALDTLKDLLFWSMKENLNVQFVYPDYELPAEYKAVIDSVDHADVVADSCTDERLKRDADVVVFDSIAALPGSALKQSQSAVVRVALKDFIKQADAVAKTLPTLSRLNVVFTDVEEFTDEMQDEYAAALKLIADAVAKEYEQRHAVQVNLLTDRILLDKMNNCNAGDEHVTAAPDGKFYVCPAFYLDGAKGYAIGSVEKGLDIKNPQLYKRAFAPICRECDAFHCKRCTWLNHRLTLEVNTPSRQQCVMAHIERNASRDLLAKIREIGEFMPEVTIPQLDYLDPFDKIVER